MFITVIPVAINQGHCDSTVHCTRISVMSIRRNCTLVSEYEQSFKLPLNEQRQCGVKLKLRTMWFVFIPRYYSDMYFE
jgi:hypothetical protein